MASRFFRSVVSDFSINLVRCMKPWPKLISMFSTAGVCRVSVKRLVLLKPFVRNSFSTDDSKRCKSVILTTALSLSLFMKKEQESDTEVDSSKKTTARILPSDDDDIIQLLKRAKLFEMKQEFDRADEFYHQALGVVNINQQNRTWSAERALQARLYIFDGLANMALMRGDFTNAEKLFKQVMQGLLQQGKKPDDNAMVEISLKLSVIYAALNRTAEAETGYRFCVEMLETKINTLTATAAAADDKPDDDTVALLGMSVEAYARFLIVQKDYAGALTNLQKALSIATTVLGERHHQIAVLLNDIATVSSLLQDYDAASSALHRAVVIGEATDHNHLSTLYFNLGALYNHKGNHTDAHKLYSKALSVAKRNDDKEMINRIEEALKNLNAGN